MIKEGKNFGDVFVLYLINLIKLLTSESPYCILVIWVNEMGRDYEGIIDWYVVQFYRCVTICIFGRIWSWGIWSSLYSSDSIVWIVFVKVEEVGKFWWIRYYLSKMSYCVKC